jgi:hypothetical protein
MPNKGYKQSPSHRARIARGLAKRRKIVEAALEAFHLNRDRKPFKPKPDPTPTPIPPSASKITSDLPQRWGAYGHHADGQYYFKREQADTLPELRKLIKNYDLHTTPIWTYVRSGRTDAELLLPIRIPEAVAKTLGHRWHFLKGKL